jgi:hypothetical protein
MPLDHFFYEKTHRKASISSDGFEDLRDFKKRVRFVEEIYFEEYNEARQEKKESHQEPLGLFFCLL